MEECICGNKFNKAKDLNIHLKLNARDSIPHKRKKIKKEKKSKRTQKGLFDE